MAAPRRSTLARRSGLGLLAAAGAGLLVWGAASASGGPDVSAGPLPAANDAGATSLPPWPAPADPSAGMRAAGLETSDMSTPGQHLHAHLDVIVDGIPVPVPANLGVSAASGQMSELHTHDPGGLIHVETSNATARYTLGQLFNEWDVRLGQATIGGLSAGGGKTLSAYVDGDKVEGNPAAIPLRDRAEIALVFGAPATNPSPPADYDFGAM